MEWLNVMDAYLSDWARSQGYATESLLRLVLAMLCGGAVGLERQVRGREAGFRTNALVCLGSALVMIVSIHFAVEPWQSPQKTPNVNLSIDPARVAYGVMGGIGFLGAGAILKTGGSIRGLTTAAGMWCVAAIGLSAGFGMYGVTLLATFLVIFALWVLDYIGELLPNQRFYELVLRRRWEPDCLQAAVRKLNDLNIEVVETAFERPAEAPHVDLRITIAITGKYHHHNLERQIEMGEEYQLLSAHQV